jgi:LPXTG-site transpeptidase (sortase) family protein
MKTISFKPGQFYAIGILLLGLSVANLFLDIPELIREYSLERRINAPTSQQNYSEISSPVDQRIIPVTGSSSIEKSALRQDLIQLKRLLLTKKAASPKIVRNAYIPDRIVIDSIKLDAPVIIATNQSIELKDQWFEQWIAPDEFAVGWHDHSAPLGIPGNTVLNGHHNEFGKVFANLVYLKDGDLIRVYSGNKSFWFEVSEMMVLNEREASIESRMENARWISETADERLTLVTCWPKRTNTHRLIVVAYPVVLENTSK